MAISAKTVMELRGRTGVAMMECKKALAEAKGDLDEAEKILRKQDKVKAGKKAGRSAEQGLVTCYIHAGGKLGVLLEINCESDFTASNEEFGNLCKDVGMHIAAAEPRFISRAEVGQDIIDGEKEIYRAQVEKMGNKPADVIEKIVDGKLNSFYGENCLLEQAFVKDPAVTVLERLQQTISKTGENMKIKRFVRFKLGEDASTVAHLVDAPVQD